MPASPPAFISISVSLLSVIACFLATPSYAECVVSTLLTSFLCFCASSFLSLASLSSLLCCISVAMSSNSNSVGMSVGTLLFLALLPFLGPIFLCKSSICEKTKQNPNHKSAQLVSQYLILVNL